MANISGTVPPTPVAVGLPPISSEWRAFFTTLVNRTGGSTGTDVNNVTVKVANISDATPLGRSILTAPEGSNVRELIGAGTSSLGIEDVAEAIQGTVSATYNGEDGTIETVLAPTGVVPGTYGSVRVQADGRVVAGNATAPTSFPYAFALGIGL